MVESLWQCVATIDGLARVQGSGGIEQAMKVVVQECWQFLSMHGGRFSCTQALETKLFVPHVDAVSVLEWFGGIKQFPQAQQVAQILSHGVPVRVNGDEDLKAALQYSNRSSIDQYTGHFMTTVVEDVRLGRALIFPREVASRIPGLRVSPVGVAASATKVRIIHNLTMAFSNPGANGDTDFESAPKCKLGDVLRDIVWRILFLRRTLAPHTHIMLSKMDAKDAFRQVAVEWDGCKSFGYVFGDIVVVDRRLVFGWRNSPGFYFLLAGEIEHAHDSTSFDDAVVAPQGLTATRHVRGDITAAGEALMPLPPECRVPSGQGGGVTGTFWARSYVDDTIGVEPLVCARGSRRLRASASLASDHFRLFGPRLPTDPPLLAPAKVSSWSTSLDVLGWTIDTVAMVISLTSAKLLQLSLLLEARPPARAVASEYELRVFQRLGGSRIRRFRPRGGHQNNPLRG